MCQGCAALLFHKPSLDEAGHYTCHAMVDGNEVNTGFTLNMYGRSDMMISIACML